MNNFNRIFSENGIKGITGYMDNLFIFHLYGDSFEKHLFTREKLMQICRSIENSLIDIDRYLLCTGPTVQGIANINHSYNTALSNMKMIFFKGYNKIYFNNENNYPEFDFAEDPLRILSNYCRDINTIN